MAVKYRFGFIVVATCLLFTSIFSCAIACEPCKVEAGNAEAIKNAFNNSDVVLVATVVGAMRNEQPSIVSDSRFLTEKVKFRVERVFKGKFKIGDYYYTETVIGLGGCGAGGKSVIDAPVRYVDRDAGDGLSKKWLIYGTNRSVNRLQGCRTLPLDLAEQLGDIKVLESSIFPKE